MSEYEFTVEFHEQYDREAEEVEIPADPGRTWKPEAYTHTRAAIHRPAYYEVSLPHQCDEWDIAKTSTKEEAINALQEFIDKANEAMKELKAL